MTEDTLLLVVGTLTLALVLWALVTILRWGAEDE
jgi:hypothetical protein